MNIMDIDWDEYNIRADAAIDPAQLDVCWLEQPNLVAKYGKVLARAEMEVKRLDEQVKSIRSELTMQVTEDPSLLGAGVKPTAPVVEAYYRSDSEYQKQKGRRINAEAIAERLRQSINTLYHRRYALENLVRLQGQEYFAGPRTPRDLTEKWEERATTNKAAANVKAATKRTRRRTT
jgi:hypothetical protein